MDSAQTRGHQEYKISGVSVYFPCKPYPSQFSMMDKIIKGIGRRQNCLLESPTGSGKSLALLCSSLAWQTAEKFKRDQEESENEVGPLSGSCVCECHQKEESPALPVKPPAETSPGGQHGCVDSNKVSSHGWPQLDFAAEGDDEDEDFKSKTNNFKTTPEKKGKRKHIDVEYDTDATKEELKSAGVDTASDGKLFKGPEVCCSLCSCGSAEKTKIKIPKIYFGTRTHKQVAQIVRELRKTSYHDTKMTILGSREHTCIHPEVSRMKNKNDGCKELLNDQGCRFKDSTPRLTSHKAIKDLGLSTAWDLEDLAGLCKTKKACPYFLSRGLKDDSDLIICPYNYLVDPLIREAMQINLKGHVVILDEAHNIEDSAREAASQSITQDSLLKGIKDIDALIEENINFADHSKLRSMLKSLDSFIDENKNMLEQKDFDKSYKIWSGFYIVAQLEAIGLGPKYFPQFKTALNLIQKDAELRKEKAMQAGLSRDTVEMKAATLNVLDQIFQIMDYLYREDLKYVNDYRASLVQSYNYVSTISDGQWLSSRNRHGARNTVQVEAFTLNFWCMNPGVAFSDFAETRSIVLTSGTLSPLTSFESELGLEFKIQLEANHVIKDSQVWVGTVGQGPTGTSLQAVFRNLETFSFQDELGQLVLKVCQTVPHGVLCFLPSYKVMEKLCARWESTGIMGKIQLRKRVICEPRGSDKLDFEDQMKSFYDAINPSDDELQNSSGLDGAVFFAVCRGKVSEGLDFADNYARAVITVGIPYPNFKDVQVELKRKYNDQHRQSRNLLSGHEWYEIQAFRALNQALGRCIRHRHDWGALIIVDDRFVKSSQKYCKGLSKWVRNKIQAYHDFPCLMDSLSEFTKGWMQVQEKQPQLTVDMSFQETPSQNVVCQPPRTPLQDVNSSASVHPIALGQVTGASNKSRTGAGRGHRNFPIFNLGRSPHMPPSPSQPQPSILNAGNPGSFPTLSAQPTTRPLSIQGTQQGKGSAKLSKEGLNFACSYNPPLNSSTSCEVTSDRNLTCPPKALQPTLLVPPSAPFMVETSTSAPSAIPSTAAVDNVLTSTSLSSLKTPLPEQSGAHAVPVSFVMQTGVSASTVCAVAARSSSQHFDKRESKIQLRIITERALPGVRFRVFEIPTSMHSVFGGNLKLPVSTSERLVYLVDQPKNPGGNPTAKLMKMSEEEKEAILCSDQALSHQAKSNRVEIMPPSFPVTKSGLLPTAAVRPMQVMESSVLSNPSNCPAPDLLATKNLPSLGQPCGGSQTAPPGPGSQGLLVKQAVPQLRQGLQHHSGIQGVSASIFPEPHNPKKTESPTLVSLLQSPSQNSVPAHSLELEPKDKGIFINASSLQGRNISLVSRTANIQGTEQKSTPRLPSPQTALASPSPSAKTHENSRGPSPAAGRDKLSCDDLSPLLFSSPLSSLSGTNATPLRSQSDALKANSPLSLQRRKKPIFKVSEERQPVITSESLLSKASPCGAPVKCDAGTTKKQKCNTRLAAPKSAGTPKGGRSVKEGSSGGEEVSDEEDVRETSLSRRVRGRKRKRDLTNSFSKKSKDSPSCQNQEKVPPVSFKCVKCGFRLISGKQLSDFQVQRTTLGFLRETKNSKSIKSCIFFPKHPGKGGLQALESSGSGLNTKYVEQEEICIQFLYCGQCIKTSSESPEPVGAQVQLAAGSGARFSKGQVWIFESEVQQYQE